MMRNSIFYLLLGVFLTQPYVADAQEFLYLKKKYTAQTTKVFVHDVIKVRKKNGESFKGQLYQVTPDGFMVNEEFIALGDVEAIIINNSFAKGVGRSLEYGGAMFLGIFTFNGLIGGYNPVLTQGNIYFVAGLVIAGAILELIARKVYKTDKGWIIEPLIIPKE